MTGTHTYSTLAVSNAAYQEIKRKLLAVDYGHAINSNGEIDMHGIALIVQEDRGVRMPKVELQFPEKFRRKKAL